MKKLTLVAVMLASLALVANSYADVQQVRLSGEIRVRGYWTHNMTSLNSKGAWDESGFHSDSDTYIAQRTRVTVEADLDDHVMAVVTLQSEAVWGTGWRGNGFYAQGNVCHSSPNCRLNLIITHLKICKFIRTFVQSRS